MYEVFRADPEEVQQQWRVYVRRTDRLLESSLRTSVRKSLQGTCVRVRVRAL